MDRTEFEKALDSGIKFFRVIRDSDYLNSGEIVEFRYDDDSESPAFYYPNREDRECSGQSGTWAYVLLYDLEPLTIDEQEQFISRNTEAENETKVSCTDTNKHYCIDGIQPIQYCQRCLTPEQFQGACIKDVIKYLSRFGKKDEKIREAEKALDYALWLYMSVAGKDVDPTKHNHEAIFKALEID